VTKKRHAVAPTQAAARRPGSSAGSDGDGTGIVAFQISGADALSYFFFSVD
jgi:hypothetical protein